MTYQIPLMRSAFLREADTLSALAEWIASGPSRLSMGDLCSAFEIQFARWQGRQHAVLFNSGASANLAIFQALQNLGFLPGSRVGFSALTWATNVMPIMQMGYLPVAVDVDPCTLNVMSETFEQVAQNVDALFITNALGYLPDLDRIRAICNAERIMLIEDNCESLGSELPAGRAGNFGIASSFSFFVAHHMSTIEGGMVCTDDGDLAEMLRMVRANGWDRNLTAAQQQKWRALFGNKDEFDAKYTFYVPAFNVRPTEITGFLGLCQLGHLDSNIRARQEKYEALEMVAVENDDLIRLRRDHMSTLSPFAFPVLCQSPELRRSYMQRFAAAGVEIRPVIAGNIAKQPFYRHLDEGAKLPGADQVEACGFYFGIYPDLTHEDMGVLAGCLAAREAA